MTSQHLIQPQIVKGGKFCHISRH